LDILTFVNGTIAELLGGRADGPSNAILQPPAVKKVLKLGRETAGRRGKCVSVIWDIPLDDRATAELATHLKARCGTGGTVKEGRIEIQGDHRERIATELAKLGFGVKRVGG
jgi:predicted translation initiation factor SUI1